MGHGPPYQPIAELFSTKQQQKQQHQREHTVKLTISQIITAAMLFILASELRTTHPSHHTHRGIIRFNYGDRPTPRRHYRTRPLFTIRSVTAVTS
eukprot:scaffold106159_cov45-Cyclotella_meneghiniana.AAC.1